VWIQDAVYEHDFNFLCTGRRLDILQVILLYLTNRLTQNISFRGFPTLEFFTDAAVTQNDNATAGPQLPLGMPDCIRPRDMVQLP
jgi:hypothetical protein